MLHEGRVAIQSGSYFSKLKWFGNYRATRQQFGEDRAAALGQTLTVGVEKPIQPYLTGLINYSYSDNQNYTVNNENGQVLTGGLRYEPSRYWSSEARLGTDEALKPNAELSTKLRFSERTHMMLGYTHTTRGLAPGNHWQGELQHGTRYFTNTLRYTEGVANAQEILSNDTFNDTSSNPVPFGNPLFDADNDDFLRRRLELDIVFERARTKLGLSGGYEIRDYDVRSNEQAWNIELEAARKIGERTTLENNLRYSDSQGSFNQWHNRISLSHQLASNFQVSAGYEYFNNDGETQADRWQENRLTAGGRYQF
jgi:hypothetical protein